MIKRSLLWIIDVYQKTVSPVLAQQQTQQDIPLCCKYYPSCSSYGKQTLQKYPVWKALPKIIWRILRCNPWSKGGVDLP